MREKVRSMSLMMLLQAEQKYAEKFSKKQDGYWNYLHGTSKTAKAQCVDTGGLKLSLRTSMWLAGAARAREACEKVGMTLPGPLPAMPTFRVKEVSTEVQEALWGAHPRGSAMPSVLPASSADDVDISGEDELDAVVEGSGAFLDTADVDVEPAAGVDSGAGAGAEGSVGVEPGADRVPDDLDEAALDTAISLPPGGVPSAEAAAAAAMAASAAAMAASALRAVGPLPVVSLAEAVAADMAVEPTMADAPAPSAGAGKARRQLLVNGQYMGLLQATGMLNRMYPSVKVSASRLQRVQQASRPEGGAASAAAGQLEGGASDPIAGAGAIIAEAGNAEAGDVEFDASELAVGSHVAVLFQPPRGRPFMDVGTVMKMSKKVGRSAKPFYGRASLQDRDSDIMVNLSWFKPHSDASSAGDVFLYPVADHNWYSINTVICIVPMEPVDATADVPPEDQTLFQPREASDLQEARDFVADFAADIGSRSAGGSRPTGVSRRNIIAPSPDPPAFRVPGWTDHSSFGRQRRPPHRFADFHTGSG